MLIMLLGLMFFFLLLNFPMFIPMIVAPLAVMYNYMLSMDMSMACQQLIAGVSSQVLLSVMAVWL